MSSASINALFKKARDYYLNGDREQALAVLREVLDRDPSNAGAHNNLGLLLYEMNNIEESITAYKESIRINPGYAEVYCNCAAALCAKGALAEAEAYYQKAVELKSGLFEAIVGLGTIKHAGGDLETAKKFYCEALRIKPDYCIAHFRLGKIMREWDRLDHAEVCFRNALRIEPGNILALLNLGETMQAAGAIEESEDIFRTVIDIDPANDIAQSNLFISMNYNPAHSPRRIFEAHRRWGKHYDASLTPKAAAFANSVDPERRLRLGYVSSDFCRHPAASFLDPVMRYRDRERFSIIGYSQGAVRDEKTERFKSFADDWREIRDRSDEEVARIIRQDAIDILIDCTGHMADNRLPLFARKCAPLQISWIGYPNTTGLAAIDYRFTDDIVDPQSEDEALFTEKLVRLERGFCCYAPPENAPPLSPLPALTKGYITFGSLHTIARLNREVIGVWSKALKQFPSSRMVIFRNTLDEEIVRRLSEFFRENGVDPQRIDFGREVPKAGHLAVYDSIDIALDTVPWSGHTTACEALWMGVPVITLRGDRHAGRMVASVLTRIGLVQCIAKSGEAFVDSAQRLAGDIPALSRLRSGLREMMLASPLCDGLGFTRIVEREYRKIWRQWCNRRA